MVNIHLYEKGYTMITYDQFLEMQNTFLNIINSNSTTELDVRHDIAYTSVSDMPAGNEKVRRVSRFIGVKVGQARNAAVTTGNVAVKIIKHPVTQVAAITATCSFFATILIAALMLSQNAAQLFSLLVLLGMFFYVCYLALASTF